MEYRMITAPVIIPRRPDCDYKQGEPPLTEEQITNLQKTFEKYQIIDYDHQLTNPDSEWFMTKLGTPIKSWISKNETTYTNVLGKTETIPMGTWWLTTQVTHPRAIKLIDNGLLTAYSITVGNRQFSDKFLKQMSIANKNKNMDSSILAADLLASKRKTLIKDIVDPVGFTVSLTGLPCVDSALFSSDCLEKSRRDSQTSKKNGGQNMSEETRFSISELLGLKEFFANKNDTEEKQEKQAEAPKEENDGQETQKYVTPEELDQKLDEFKEEFKGELVDIFDEKLEEVVEKLTVKKEEEDKDGEDKEEGETGAENTEESGEEETANKHYTPSSQLDNTDDGYNLNTANKNKTNKAKFMEKLNRKANGEYKFPKAY